MKNENQSAALILNSKGQGLTEYLILLLLVAVISVGAAKSLGSTVKKKLQLAERHIEGQVRLEDDSK